MNLLVFNHESRLVVLVSSRALRYTARLFLPLVEAEQPELQHVDEAVLVRVRYQERAYVVPFLLIEVIAADDNFLRHPVGVLTEEHSRDILNNLRDTLDWD